ARQPGQALAATVSDPRIASANVPVESIISLKGAHRMNSRRLRKSIPKPACPGCRMIKNEWPGEGYTHDGETYCCQGCAEGTGCTCVVVEKLGFSRVGIKLTRAATRLDEQRAGAPTQQVEL